MINRLANLLEVIALLAFVSVALGFLGRWHFLPDLASHFRIQATYGALVAGLLLWPLKRKFHSVASLLLGLLLLLSVYPWRESREGEVNAAYRLISMNVLTENTQRDLVLDLILRQDPDFVALQETDAAWVEALDIGLTDRWPYRKAVPRNDNFGIALYSKLPWTRCDVLYLSDRAPTPSISAKFDLPDGQPLRLIVTHPLPPMSGNSWAARNELFEKLAIDIAATGPERTILAGDLNCTAWSGCFADLLSNSHLLNSSHGQGLGISWMPFGTRLLGLPIDHVLYGEGIRIAQRTTGPYTGSDHRPVIVDFE